jgi:surface antigen
MRFSAPGFWNRACLILALAFIAFLPAHPAFALNCVEYVRKVSGLDLEGDAWKWWSAANGRYERGHTPKENAILVFDHSGIMEHGHVAIVAKVMNDRLITINHANWAHYHSLKGHISTGVMVQDVSDKNDWSEVKVMDEASQSFGRSNRTLGFIYGGSKAAAGAVVADNDDSGAETGKIKDIDNE